MLRFKVCTQELSAVANMRSAQHQSRISINWQDRASSADTDKATALCTEYCYMISPKEDDLSMALKMIVDHAFTRTNA